MIRPGEISRLAHRLRLGDKTIEKDYVLTWVLLAIAHSSLRGRGAALTAATGARSRGHPAPGQPTIPASCRGS